MLNESRDVRWVDHRVYPGQGTARHRLASLPPRQTLDQTTEQGVLQPERGGAIQALTHDVLVTRSLEVSSSGFITIISIIQGVALALLAQNTFASPSPLVFFQSFSLLLILVTVFYYYVNMSVLLRWAPSFLDAFLPFGIAGLEIPPAYFLGHGAAWNASLAAFWAFTSGGLLMTIGWTPLSHFGRDRTAHRMMLRMLRELKLATGAGGLASAILAVLSATVGGGPAWWGSAGAAVALVTVGMVVARTEIGASKIHEHYGVNRPPFN